MKTKNKPHFLLMAAIVAVFAAFTVSCNKDDDPSLADLRQDKLEYLEDSLRISDSLRLIGNAGVVNYSITIVDGATSSIFSEGETSVIDNGKSQQTQSALADAIVTISQYGKTLTDTTDASGMVVFNGFFRSAVNITVRKPDYTTVSYISAVNVQDSTRTGTISFVGNMIPIFPLTGPNTATISGRATIQTNLTNRVKEAVPAGTPITAYIDARDEYFSTKFLTTGIADKYFISECGCQFVYVGNILQASYSTGIIGTTDANGNYSITVPAAVDGLPISLNYSDIAADQTLYVNEGWPGTQTPGDRTGTYRNLFSPEFLTSTLSFIPPGSDIEVTFKSYDTEATASAIVSALTGAIESVTVTASGLDYAGTPLVEITGGSGTGAVANAVMSNGKVVGVNVVSGGSGYSTPIGVSFISGDSLNGTGNLDANNQRVFQIVVTNGGSGYTSVPTVALTGGGGSGATATAVLSNQRVVAVNVTNNGTGYTGIPTVDITGGGGTGAAASAVMGFGVDDVTGIVGTNVNHVYVPRVIFSEPDFATGTRAQGHAIIDPATRTVTAVVVDAPGSGYLLPPNVAIFASINEAEAEVVQTGGSIIAATISNPGEGYAYPPTVQIVGTGSGATGTAVMSNGKVVGINIVTGGSGYTGAVEINLISGDGATAYATVTNSGISAITVADGGHSFTGAPRVEISAGTGGGAAATATVANGRIDQVTVTAPGTGYLEGNIPGTREPFSATKGSSVQTKPGLQYINDIHYGTGRRTTP